jgi:hypothetical protein
MVKMNLTTEHEIETTWKIAKLLINDLGSYKVFLYKLPQHGLYLQSLRPIPIVYDCRLGGPKILFAKTLYPHIAMVRYKEEDQVLGFIHSEPFKASRIFKHGMYFNDFSESCIGGFMKNVTKNMMGLFPRSTFNIKSDNRELRKLFYETAVKLNEEENIGCKFDYDEYDYTLEILPYKRYREGCFHCWAIVTILCPFSVALPRTGPSPWSSPT